MYWRAFAAFVFLHLHVIGGEWFPFYVSLILAGIIAYYFHKKVLVEIESLGWQVNTSLTMVQVIVVLLSYFGMDALVVSVVFFIIFVVLEYLRLSLGRNMSEKKRELLQHREQRQHINETFRVVRGERHDFLKHVSAVHFMLENNEANDAKRYLDELVENYEETNYSIKGERGVVAGVLHQMYRRAKAADISIVYDLDVPLSTLPIRDQKMVELVGNLLGNALDACEEYQLKRGEQALVSLQFYKRSGLFILICKNSTLPVPVDVLDSLFYTYGKTTKSGEHEGLGTKLIKDIVTDHQGFLDFVCKDGEFTLNIKVPAIK